MLEESEDSKSVQNSKIIRQNVKVIGPKNECEKAPEVLKDGVEILEGEFDYDISCLDVDEYKPAGINNNVLIS